MKFIKIGVLVLVVLSLAACARTFGYRFADTYLMWQTRSYVTLDRTQRSELRDNINALLQWHAEQEMPHYDQLLINLQDDIASQSLDDSRYNVYQQHIESRWLAVREAVLPVALELLPQLSDEQVAQLIESLAERIQERADTFAEQGVEARREEGAESYHKQLKKWFGEVTAEQEAFIASWSDDMPDMTEHWIEYRVRWAEAFRHALTQRDDKDAFAAALTPLFLAPETLRPQALQAQVAKTDVVGRQSILHIAATLNDNQRQHFIAELDSLRSDLASMAATRDVTFPPVAP